MGSKTMKIGHDLIQPVEIGKQSSEDGKIVRLRRILPQVLATTAKSSMILSSGMITAFPQILISVLTNETGAFHLSLEQASWYGSISFIFQPFGSLLSGALLQPFGCRRLMILINLPTFACWMLTYYATSVFDLYVTSALFGFVVGLMEAPTIRYIGEIAHPSLRAILTTYSQTYLNVAYILIYYLASFTDWRHEALICGTVPIICAIALLWVPETPMWLMSKGRPMEALKSLQWLRGWTSVAEVKAEFDKLKIYAKKNKSQRILSPIEEGDPNDEEERQNLLSSNRSSRYTEDSAINSDSSIDEGDIDNIRIGPINHIEELEDFEERSVTKKLRGLARRDLLVPMGKCMLLFTLNVLCGVKPMQPFMLKIFDQLKLPVQPNELSGFQSTINLVNTVLFICIIERVGKKRLLLFCSTLAIVCLSLLALLTRKLSANPENGLDDDPVTQWLVMALFVVHTFSLSLGIWPIPWIYVSEILPFKGRGIATGIIVSYFYIIIFTGVKSYPTLVQELNLDGTFLFFALISIPCVCAAYFVLPETEGRFLADIEAEVTQKNLEKERLDYLEI